MVGRERENRGDLGPRLPYPRESQPQCVPGGRSSTDSGFRVSQSGFVDEDKGRRSSRVLVDKVGSRPPLSVVLGRGHM